MVIAYDSVRNGCRMFSAAIFFDKEGPFAFKFC